MRHTRTILLFTLAFMFAAPLSVADVPDPSQEHQHHVHDNVTIGVRSNTSSASRDISIIARDVAFEPTTIELRRGESVRFVVTNTGSLPHEFVLGTTDDQRKHNADMQSLSHEEMSEHMQNESNGILLQPGETRELIWTFSTELEEIQFACHIPGHYESGMFGSISILNNID